ncbi:MAG TPA: rhodanese-like domain-containing protein [Sulfuricurvum sp.]|nr:rhodanese-like domain-containing protein [Sulfuricurvum sp.]
MLRLIFSAFLSILLATSLSGVEYDGEKSIIFETKYDVCIIPPQVSEATAKGIKVVDVVTAKKLYDQNSYFYDAREKRHYQKEHIKGAHPVYFDVSKAEFIVIQLPKDKDEKILFYCYGETCANSYEAALAVRKLGYTNVYWLLNGFSEWKSKKYPIESN